MAEVNKKTTNSAKSLTEKSRSVQAKAGEKKITVKVSKPAKKADIKVEAVKKVSTGTNSTYKASIVSVLGESKGTMSLPSDIFGIKPNKKLINQAVRVYLANQRQGTSSTKTRAEVVGSTRKIYRQKGTGRARHGANKAPLFVGGGIAFGPKPRDFSLKMPQKMRKIALLSALSEKAKEGAISIVDGDFSGKTKEVSNLFKKLTLTNKRGRVNRVLLVVPQGTKTRQGARNVAGVEILDAISLTTYPVVINKNILFLKNAVDELEKKFK